MKLPRLAAALVFVLIAACLQTTLSSAANLPRLVAPNLTRPLVETFPGPAEPDDDVKKAVFARINQDRARHGLAPVAWDAAASRVSDAFCRQQVREKSQGHFLTNGLPPYARMAFAGVFGMGSENSAMWATSGVEIEKNPVHFALSSHDHMMEERPPNDGHRRAILDSDATHVGVGYFVQDGRMQMSQEFLARRLERLSLSSATDRFAALAVEGRVLGPDRIQFVTIAREPRPTPLTRKEASDRKSYSYPHPAEALVPEGSRGLEVVGTVTLDRIHLKSGREFSFTYAPAEPGLFTFVFYVALRDSDGRAKQGGSATVLFE